MDKVDRINIHVTKLGSFSMCPYKDTYDKKSVAIKNTYKGDILNIGAISSGDYLPFIKTYQDIYGLDFKEYTMLVKSCNEVREYVKDIRETCTEVYQESKLFKQWNDYDIIGSVDICWVTKEGGLIIEDFKYSTHDYYCKNNEIFLYNSQSFLYPLMFMELLGKEICTFSFVCRDKKKGTMKKNTVIRHRQECQDYLDKVMMLYTECEALGERPRCHNTFCEGCPLKDGCPERFTK